MNISVRWLEKWSAPQGGTQLHISITAQPNRFSKVKYNIQGGYKYCGFFSLKCCDFSELCPSSAAGLMFYLPDVCTNTDAQ